MDQAQAKFEGWAVVEMMGHQREIGFVTTEYFGGAALFRVDSPEIPEREYVLERPEHTRHEGRYVTLPVGSTVKRTSIPAKSRLVSPAALYALNPCTEETARKAIEEMVPRALIVLHIAESQKTLPGAQGDPFGQDICEECGQLEEECLCIHEGSNE
jgi:hypothetical protein